MDFKELLSPDEENIWRRNLLVLCAAQFVALIGMSGVFPFLPLYVEQLGITNQEDANFWSGLVFAGTYFSAVFMIPIWGSLGDKYGRKIMSIRAIFGLAISVALMAYAQNVYQLFLLRFLQGAMSGLIASALGFVSANTPEEKSGYAIGWLQGSIAAGQVFGPFFGGAMADLVGIRHVFTIVGILCAIGGLLLIFFLKEINFQPRTDKKYGIIGNLKFVIANSNFRLLMTLIVLTQAGIQFTVPIFAFFIKKIERPDFLTNFDATATGIMFGVVAIFNIIFAPKWGKRNDTKPWQKTLRTAAGVSGLMFLLHIFAENFWYLLPLRAVIGIFYAALIPTLYAALSKRSNVHQKGGIMGLASGANLLGSLISFLLAGVVSSEFGMEANFLVSFVLLTTVAIIAFSTGLDRFQTDFFEKAKTVE